MSSTPGFSPKGISAASCSTHVDSCEVTEKAVPQSGKKTPHPRTPKSRQTSPSSEFGYDDAYSANGDVFAEGVSRKTRMVTRRKSSKRAAVFKSVKTTFLAPTTCSTIKRRSKMVPETPKVVSEPFVGPKPSTIPQSPHFRIRPSVAKTEVKLTSEELMLQKLEAEKAVEVERAAKARKLYEVLKARASRKNSKLYGRVPGSAKKATPKKEKKFVKPRKVASLPVSPPVSTAKKGPGGVTLPEPFSFATDKRIQPPPVPAPEDTARTVPTAELAQQFMRDSRSHGAPANAAQKITIGQSPQLRTKRRGQYAASKPRPPTREEVVEAEMEEIKKHPFKALALDRRIFESAGELGVPKIAARPLTEPHEFEFRSEKRLAHARQQRDLAATGGSVGSAGSPAKKTCTAFKARPAPKTTTQAPIPCPKTVFKPTIAMSPKFRGGGRASVAPERRQRAPTTASTEKNRSLKAQGPRKPTEPREFKFATSGRHEYHKKVLDQQMAEQEAAAAAARERKAQPAPDFSRLSFQPDRSALKPPPTEPKPFNLRSSARHADAQAAFQQEVQQVLAEQAKPAEFHARPVPPSVYKPDTVFVEPQHAPVVPLPVTLQSEQRAAKRQAFDQEMGKKMAQLEEMQEAIARQRAEQENKQLQALRRKSVEEGGLMFKAKPILTKDQFPSRRSANPAPVPALTTPLSPQLRTKTRSAVKSAASQSNAAVFEVLASASTSDLGKPQRRVAAKSVGRAASAAEEQSRDAVLAAALDAM